MNDGRIHTPSCEDCRRLGICAEHKHLFKTGSEWDPRLVADWHRYSHWLRRKHGQD